jgi:hypothetical protein
MVFAHQQRIRGWFCTSRALAPALMPQAGERRVRVTKMVRAQVEPAETMQSDNEETLIPPPSLDHVPDSQLVTPPYP